MSENLFCSQCGTRLPKGSAFCGNCGAKVSTSERAEVPHEEASRNGSSRDAQTASAQQPEQSSATSATPRNPDAPWVFKRLMQALWTSIGLFALSYVVGCFDVRCYYANGQFGALLLSVIMIASFVCLAQGISHRMNWARVTYIAQAGLIVVSTVVNLFIGNFKGGIVDILDLGGAVISVYCITILCGKDVARTFERQVNGVKKAVTYWSVLVAALIALAVYSCMYVSNDRDSYLVNCAKAAAKGDEGAWVPLAEYVLEQNGGYEISEDELNKEVSSLIEEVCGENYERSRSMNKAADKAMSKAMSKSMIKAGLPIVLVVVLAVFGWIKKQFGDKEGE